MYLRSRVPFFVLLLNGRKWLLQKYNLLFHRLCFVTLKKVLLPNSLITLACRRFNRILRQCLLRLVTVSCSPRNYYARLARWPSKHRHMYIYISSGERGTRERFRRSFGPFVERNDEHRALQTPPA